MQFSESVQKQVLVKYGSTTSRSSTGEFCTLSGYLHQTAFISVNTCCFTVGYQDILYCLVSVYLGFKTNLLLIFK